MSVGLGSLRDANTKRIKRIKEIQDEEKWTVNSPTVMVGGALNGLGGWPKQNECISIFNFFYFASSMTLVDVFGLFFSSSFSLSLWLTKYPSLYGSCCRHGTALVTANTLKNMWPSLLLLEWGGRTAAWYASRASVKRKLELHDDGNTVCYYKLKFSKDRRTKKVARLVVYHFFLFFPPFFKFQKSRHHSPKDDGE